MHEMHARLHFADWKAATDQQNQQSGFHKMPHRKCTLVHSIRGITDSIANEIADQTNVTSATMGSCIVYGCI